MSTTMAGIRIHEEAPVVKTHFLKIKPVKRLRFKTLAWSAQQQCVHDTRRRLRNQTGRVEPGWSVCSSYLLALPLWFPGSVRNIELNSESATQMSS